MAVSIAAEQRHFSTVDHPPKTKQWLGLGRWVCTADEGQADDAPETRPVSDKEGPSGLRVDGCRTLITSDCISVNGRVIR